MLVAGPLQVGHVAVVDAQRRVLRVRGDRVAQVGPDVEQLILDPGEQARQAGIQAAEGDGGPDGGIGLVHVGVGHQPGVGLGHPAAAAERGGPAVAGAGIDAGQHDGLVLAVCWHAHTVAGGAARPRLPAVRGAAGRTVLSVPVAAAIQVDPGTYGSSGLSLRCPWQFSHYPPGERSALRRPCGLRLSLTARTVIMRWLCTTTS